MSRNPKFKVTFNEDLQHESYFFLKRLIEKLLLDQLELDLNSRVSSAQQDIQKQILLAKAYINNQKIDLEKVIWLKDNDVYANKFAMEERPELQQLRMLIKQKNLKLSLYIVEIV